MGNSNITKNREPKRYYVDTTETTYHTYIVVFEGDKDSLDQAIRSGEVELTDIYDTQVDDFYITDMSELTDKDI